MGTLLKCAKWIEQVKKLCRDFNAVFKLAKEEIIARHSCRCWQRNNLVPTMLILAL